LPAPFSWLSTGMVWALLPCGMVYSMLLLALATGSSAQGAWALLWFGLGTLPAMLLTSVASAGLGPSLVTDPRAATDAPTRGRRHRPAGPLESGSARPLDARDDVIFKPRDGAHLRPRQLPDPAKTPNIFAVE
jgi:hypothetical protein